jgi:hypothetical protein
MVLTDAELDGVVGANARNMTPAQYDSYTNGGTGCTIRWLYCTNRPCSR